MISGTFAQFGEPKDAFKLDRGVRGITYVNGNVWICNEDLEGILVMNVNTGKVIRMIMLNSPISCYHTPKNKDNIVYCSTKNVRFGGAVYAIDAYTFEPIEDLVYRTKHMKHPTGITSYKGVLYVAEQSHNCIHMFDMDTAKHKGKFVHTKLLPGRIEQLLLSDI